jgi:hypothetical protein
MLYIKNKRVVQTNTTQHDITQEQLRSYHSIIKNSKVIALSTPNTQIHLVFVFVFLKGDITATTTYSS